MPPTGAVTRRAAVRRTIEPFLRRLASRAETLGVIILSSAAEVARSHDFDDTSDVDLAVFVSAPAGAPPPWLPNFSFFIPVECGRVEMNIHQLILADEETHVADWDGVRAEAYSTAETYYDPEGRVTTLISRGLQETWQKGPQRIAFLRSRLWWDASRLPLQQLERGRILDAHLILNAAVDETLELAFWLADHFPPATKWRVSEAGRLDLFTAAEAQLLRRAIKSGNLDRETAIERSGALVQLAQAAFDVRFDDCEPYATYSAFFSPDRQLLPATAADLSSESVALRTGLPSERAWTLINWLVLDETEVPLVDLEGHASVLWPRTGR